MKFGLINGQRIVAKPGIRGVVCPKCRTELVAKCGEIRVHHWAHKNKLQCDDWIEDDNDWRSDWLKAFPEDWQEPLIECNGESHFADIRTPSNTIILLHQLHLTSETIRLREDFYQTPVWVVNSGRYKNEVTRFLRSFEKTWISGTGQSIGNTDVKKISEFNVDKVFRKEWLTSQFPVFFDYTTTNGDKEHGYGCMLDYVWCLMPYSVQGFRILFKYSKNELIDKLKRRRGYDLQAMRKREKWFEERLSKNHLR